MFRKVIQTNHRGSTLIIRLMVGTVFLSEGIQKFLFPEVTGAGRFEKIGFTYPEFWAQFTGCFEVLCGLLVLTGLLTRPAVIPLLIIMTVAFITTKYPVFLEKGFWAMAHEYRTDFAMTLGSLFLLIQGGGRWSLDKKIMHRKWR